MERNYEEEAIIIRNLAKRVIKECSSDNINVPLDLSVYLVDLKLLQLSKSLLAVVSDRKTADTIVEKCVSDLKENSFWINTLKLQIFWREKYRCRDEIKKIHHETVFKNVLPLMVEISETVLTRSLDKEDIYKKIVIFIIMFAGLGSPTHQNIIKETQAALHSIFKSTEMDNFLSLPKQTKEQQLIEFARLITGIRLFNKDCKKGGEGIDDLPLILTQGVQATKDRINAFKQQTDRRIDHLVKALTNIYNFNEEEPEAEVDLPPRFQFNDVEELKSVLIYFRQLEVCLKDLLGDLEESETAIDKLVQRLQSTLLQVHEVVRYRVAIATVQVFPLFLQLSNIWVEMQEEVDILSEINNNFVDLSAVANLPEPSGLETDLSTTLEDVVPSDGSEISDDSFEFYPGVKICSFSSISDEECLRFEGFCAYSLAHTGILLIGNVNIGVMYFSKNFYAFSSAEAAYKWAKDPRRYIKAVYTMAKDKPELIRLLNLYEELENFIEEEKAFEDRKRTKENAEVQTELHPIESNINRNYTFSEWELKRRALKLADLTRHATKSQQTVRESMFRTDTGIQVNSFANNSTQTRRDGSCSHPKYPKFVWRLKVGNPDTGKRTTECEN